MPYYTDPNQTKFSLEEPLFEQTGSFPEEEVPDLPPSKPLLKQKKFVIALIGGVTLLVLGILFLVNSYIQSQKLIQDVALPDEKETVVTNPSDPLYRRIMSAQKELKDADPSEQDLIYPTMDYDIYLDEPDN